MTFMANCIFCKIISGDIPSTKIFEDDNTLAFLDIKPVNPGHTLVVPKNHSTNIFDIPEKDYLAVMRTVRTITPAIRTGVGAEGVNITSSNEKAAGQEVFHLHVHIIPRFEKDMLKHWPHGEYQGEEAEKVSEKIKKSLS